MLERQEGSWKCVATSFAFAIGHLTQDLGFRAWIVDSHSTQTPLIITRLTRRIAETS